MVDLVRDVSEFDVSGNCEHFATLRVICRPCGHPHAFKHGCGSRWSGVCPHCAKRRARKTYNRFMSGYVGMKSPKFITLTLKRNKRGFCDLFDVRDDITSLKKIWSMRKLLFRALRESKDDYGRPIRIGSWFAVVELPNHIHLIADCDYIPQKLIREEWSKITHGSFKVDIRKASDCGGPRAIAAYFTKYLTKAMSGESIPPDVPVYDFDGEPVVNIGLDLTSGLPVRISSWNSPKVYSLVPFDSLSRFHMINSNGIGVTVHVKMHCFSCGRDDGFKVMGEDIFNEYVEWWKTNTGPPAGFLNIFVSESA